MAVTMLGTQLHNINVFLLERSKAKRTNTEEKEETNNRMQEEWKRVKSEAGFEISKIRKFCRDNLCQWAFVFLSF